MFQDYFSSSSLPYLFWKSLKTLHSNLIFNTEKEKILFLPQQSYFLKNLALENYIAALQIITLCRSKGTVIVCSATHYHSHKVRF